MKHTGDLLVAVTLSVGQAREMHRVISYGEIKSGWERRRALCGLFGISESGIAVVFAPRLKFHRYAVMKLTRLIVLPPRLTRYSDACCE